ncbi:hypothetical protein SBF1_1130002 [Candidatus Desulfosporosinus infrequens]|uniref:Uncharacterized protein n=1 Tax=Candidatus Desulfosporosinus infrequens TaxID=2043169 RepID=A0A2U3JYV4_9FIRM|nr:hypothetical protein SBF1_1130002 [Candidatus Desulfosporosinus infrequens]
MPHPLPPFGFHPSELAKERFRELLSHHRIVNLFALYTHSVQAESASRGRFLIACQHGIYAKSLVLIDQFHLVLSIQSRIL